MPGWGGGLRRLVRLVTAVFVAVSMSGAAWAACVAERPEVMAATDPALCRSLEAAVRHPSALPLADYEAKLDLFFGHYCHRDPAAGWVHDKFVRDAGPFIATLVGNTWQGKDFGTHAPVMIWYSPDMAAWLKANRPVGSPAPATPAPIPDGAMMVKEMYPAPASSCRNVDPLKLFPVNGAAVMIRDSGASHDGWFWGWYGFGSSSGWTPDWPPDSANSLPNMGFAQYCMNCHASAASNLTFASLRNIAGEAGEPLSFLSQDFFENAPAGPSRDAVVVLPPAAGQRLGQPLFQPDDAVVAALRAYAMKIPNTESVAKMPSETYDNTWVSAGGPKPSDTFLTSSQCIGCHDAGSTGLQFDMTMPDPHGGGLLLNLSPYATWRSSPMGLAGRDPIFFAQLASETQTFHPAIAGTVQTTCLGCHGIGGQRQFRIDRHAQDGSCPDFTRDMVDAVPWPADNPGAAHANYGMLARDGITCTACHHMALGEKASAAVAGAAQNACVAERQALLNPDSSGFARTFSGSFLVGAPGEMMGPFDKPVETPMQTALGVKPIHDMAIASSEVCGSCHSVHLPVVRDGKTLGHVYEQTTYAEWAFSAYRVGTTPDGPLPAGAGSLAESCQSCHMPSTNADGHPTRSKIASIQEKSNFPEAENGAAPDLPTREGFARHTLVGLNVFLIRMAEQFPDILGIRTRDPMMTGRGIDPLVATQQAMLDQASGRSATIAVDGVTLKPDALEMTVRIASKVGHKFPSGVGFRRAFVSLDVLDQNGETIWASGRTNPAGAIVDQNGAPIEGEYWWKDDCSARLEPGKLPHQPHFQTIDRQDEAQIYQELVSTPPADVAAPACGPGTPPSGELTTSFLSICATVKDNRILPKGTLPVETRRAIAKALGAGEDLAEEAGPNAVGDDPDYVDGGGDALRYEVKLADLPKGARPASVRATLYYQAIPPFYLQDRFCTAKGKDTERLAFLAGRLNLAGTEAQGWKLKVVSTGTIPVPAP